MQFSIGQDKEQPAPYRHGTSAPGAVELRCLEILELLNTRSVQTASPSGGANGSGSSPPGMLRAPSSLLRSFRRFQGHFRTLPSPFSFSMSANSRSNSSWRAVMRVGTFTSISTNRSPRPYPRSFGHAFPRKTGTTEPGWVPASILSVFCPSRVGIFDGVAQNGLGDGNGHLSVEVVPVPFEKFVRFHIDPDVEGRRPAPADSRSRLRYEGAVAFRNPPRPAPSPGPVSRAGCVPWPSHALHGVREDPSHPLAPGAGGADTEKSPGTGPPARSRDTGGRPLHVFRARPRFPRTCRKGRTYRWRFPSPSQIRPLRNRCRGRKGGRCPGGRNCESGGPRRKRRTPGICRRRS